MSGPTPPPSGKSPPSTDHLRPPEQPEVRSPPALTPLLFPDNPTLPQQLPLSTVPLPELRPALAGVTVHEGHPRFEVEDVKNFNLKKLRKQAKGLSKEEAIAFWQGHIDALASLCSKGEMPFEDGKYEVQVERERARQGQNVCPASLPVSGTLSLAAGGPPPEGGMGARVSLPLAEAHAILEGKTLANSKCMSSSPITSIPSITPIPSFTSCFPSLPSNSNLKTSLPTSCSPPINSRPLTNRASPVQSGPSGHGLTGQPLTGQTLTNSKILPSSSEPLSSTSGKSTPGLAPPFLGRASSNKGSATPWADLVRASSSRMELNFVAPSRTDTGALSLREGTSKEGETFWKNTLVGYSMDRRLPFKLVQQRLLSLWGKFGIREIRVNKEGFFFFTFHAEQGATSVLKGGPWIVLGQQLVLKMWKRNFDFCKEEFKSCPNWVKLYGIPTTYWSSSGLSAIASHIGVPLYADELTSSAKLLEFARICVEMKVGSSFPTSFKVQTEFHEVFEVRVEYSWRPRQCTHCNIFGHSTQSCPKLTPKNPPPQPKMGYKAKTKASFPPESNQHMNQIGSSSGPIKTPLDNLFATLVDEEVVDALLSENVHVEASSMELVVVDEPSVSLGSTSGANDAYGSLIAATKDGCDLLDVQMVSPLAISISEDHALDTGPRMDSPTSDDTPPLLWGHKIKIIDELDRKKKKNLKRSDQRRKKLSKSSSKDSSSKGLHGTSAKDDSS